MDRSSSKDLVVNKLSRQFAILVSALLIGSAVTGGAGLVSLQQLESALQSVVTTDMQRLTLITDLRRSIRSLSVLERDYILETDSAKAAAIRDQILVGEAKTTQLLGQYQPMLLPGDAPRFTTLGADYQAWARRDAEVMAKVASGDHHAAVGLSKTHSTGWESAIKLLIDGADRRLHEKARATESTYHAARTTVLVAFVASALLGLAAGLVIYRGIRRMVAEVVALKDRLLAANEGLERTVEERTRTIRAILDHVRFGFFLVDQEHRITDGYTRSTLELLGQESIGGMAVSVALGLDPAAAANFDSQLGQLFDDMLPEELCCDQIPSRIELCGQVLRVQASAVRGADGQIVQVLFGVSDVTSLEAAERSNREAQVLLGALKNPVPFRRFVADVSTRFGSLRDAITKSDEPSALRELHTIKGNASCFGLTDLAKRAHHVEDLPHLELPPISELERNFESFLESHFDVLGIRSNDVGSETFRVTGEDLASMRAIVDEERDPDRLRQLLRARL